METVLDRSVTARRPHPPATARARGEPSGDARAGARARPGALGDPVGAAVAGAGRARDRRSACSSRSPGSASGCGCRRSGARSGLVFLGLLAAAAFAPFLAALAEPRSTACAGSTATPACRIGRRPRSPTRSPLRPERPLSVALWRAHVERALRAAKRSGRVAAPRLAARDPFALRALVLILVVATFFAAGGERMKRIAAAFDWHGVMAPAQFPHRRLGEARRPIPAGRR